MARTAHAGWMERLRKHGTGPAGSLALHGLLVWALLALVKDRPEPERGAIVFKLVDSDLLPVLEPIAPAQGEAEGSGKEGETDPLRPDEPDREEPPNPEGTMMDPPPGVPLQPGAISVSWRPQAPKEWDKRYTGTPDPAIRKALDWLAANQNRDGSWGKQHQTGYTGLALLTYLAHGSLPHHTTYGPTVGSGLEYLLGAQHDDGRFRAAAGHGYVYEHAIATYALAELAGLSRIPAAVRAAERGARVIIHHQLPGGAWGYGYDERSTRADSSVSAWQIQALKACAIAGLDAPGLDEALRRSSAGLTALFREQDAGFAYASDNRRTNPGLTALGVLGLQMNGQGGSGPARAALRTVAAGSPDFERTDGWAFYAAYYQAQALFHAGEPAFRPFARAVLPDLARRQETSGAWLPNATSEGGNDSLTRRVYGTTFAALTLQVRTRTHLGTAKLTDGLPPAREEDEVVPELIL